MKSANFQPNTLKRESFQNRIAPLMLLFFSIFFFLTTIPIIGQENFADLIKQVQINSQRSYDDISTVTYSGHSKTYFYLAYGPFDFKIIPFMDEYYFDGFWEKPDSLRIIIKAQRTVVPDSQKMNFGGMVPLPNPFQYLYDPSAFGMQKNMKNKQGVKIWPLYPFALGADSLYYYEKINEIGFGDNKILTVQVTPKNNSIPAVSGTFMIDVNKHVVVNSDVLFNEASSFARSSVHRGKKSFTLSINGSENHKIKTKKALLYASFWLPTVVEEEFEIHKLGADIKICRLIEFESYTVNPVKPDSSANVNKKIVYKPDPELEKKLLSESPDPNRLSKEEQEQMIKKIEDELSSSDLSSDLFESESIARQAFKMGLEQKYGTYFRLAQQLGNYILFNRVEGLRPGYGFNINNFLLKNSIISLSGGYGFKDKQWKGETAFLCYFDKNKKIFFEGNLYKTTGYEENQKLITTGKNSISSLLYKGDYRDYYYKTGGNIGIGYCFTENLAVKVSAVSQQETGANNHTKFSIFKYSQNFRLNPEIVEGNFQGMRASILYRTYNFDFDIFAEYNDKNNLHSDFSYCVVKANLRRSCRLTYHSSLNIYAAAAVSTGELAPQRWFDLGGKIFLNYHGNLRGVDYKAFTGDRAANATVEYSINGSAFYDLGLKYGLVKALKFAFWSGIGWSSLSDKNKFYAEGVNTPMETTNGIYSEIGIGFGDRLNIMRIDFILNSISKNKLLVSFNILQ